MGLINSDASVNAITGSTGAGQKPGATTHFSWRNNNMSIYKAFNHQHVPEIRQSLKQTQGYLDAAIDFYPLPWRLRPRYLRYRSGKDRQANRGNRSRLQGVLQGDGFTHYVDSVESTWLW